MKYRSILELLEENELYSPASVAMFAEKHNLLQATDPKDRRKEKNRIRIAMGRFSNNHHFPDSGDGMVLVKGQAPTPGWFGRRWKEAIIT